MEILFMIIKRMLLDKIFSSRLDNINYLLTRCDSFCIEMIKLIEMYELSDSLDHWLSVGVDSILTNLTELDTYRRTQLFTIKLENYNTIRSILGKNVADEVIKTIKNPTNYINYLRHHIINVSENGKKKYYDLITSNRGFKYSNEDIIAFLKYINLCITGSMNHEIDNFYNDIYTIESSKIDYNLRIKVNNEKIKKIIANCLFQLKHNIPDPRNKILKYL